MLANHQKLAEHAEIAYGKIDWQMPTCTNFISLVRSDAPLNMKANTKPRRRYWSVKADAMIHKSQA